MTRRANATLRLPRAALAAAVAPEPLAAVLGNLVEAGALEGWEARGEQIEVWGDLTALESHVALGEAPAALTEPSDRRADYYRQCRAYCSTASFRHLGRQQQAIWRLHARGESQTAICFALGVTPMRARVAIRGARLAARLPAVASTMPRGGGPGRPPALERPVCKVRGCGEQLGAHGAQGYCGTHYAWVKRAVIRQIFGR